MCVGVCVRRQGRRRARAQACRRECRGAGVPAYPRARAGACVCMYVQVRVCVRVCVCARAWVDSSHPLYINPLTERVPVYV